MNSKQHGLILMIVMLAGLFGGICGAVITYIYISNLAFAQETSTHKKIIKAEEFQVVDKYGRTRIRLLVMDDDGSAYLAFYRQDGGTPIAWLSTFSNGTTSLILNGKDSKQGIQLNVTSEGSYIAFNDNNETQRIVLSTLFDNTNLGFHKKNGEPIINLGRLQMGTLV